MRPGGVLKGGSLGWTKCHPPEFIGDTVASTPCVCGMTVEVVRNACNVASLLHPMPPCKLYLESADPGAFLEAVRTRRENLS